MASGTFRDRLHYLHSVLLGTDSIIYIPVIWFFVAELGALFFIHLEQVCRQRFSVRRQERKAGSWVSQDRDPVQKHHGKTEEARKMGQTIGEVAMRRRSSADARPTSAFRDAGLAKIIPGRKARFAGKDLQCQCASQASQAPSGQSRLRRGQFRLRGQMRSRLFGTDSFIHIGVI